MLFSRGAFLKTREGVFDGTNSEVASLQTASEETHPRKSRRRSQLRWAQNPHSEHQEGVWGERSPQCGSPPPEFGKAEQPSSWYGSHVAVCARAVTEEPTGWFLHYELWHAQGHSSILFLPGSVRSGKFPGKESSVARSKKWRSRQKRGPKHRRSLRPRHSMRGR